MRKQTHQELKREAFEVWAIARTDLDVRDFAAKYMRVRRHLQYSDLEVQNALFME